MVEFLSEFRAFGTNLRSGNTEEASNFIVNLTARLGDYIDTSS